MKTPDQPRLTQRQLDYLDSRLDEAMPLTHTDPLPVELLEQPDPDPLAGLGY